MLKTLRCVHSQSQEAGFSVPESKHTPFLLESELLLPFDTNTPLIYNLCQIILIEIFMLYSLEICFAQGRASHVEVQIF